LGGHEIDWRTMPAMVSCCAAVDAPELAVANRSAFAVADVPFGAAPHRTTTEVLCVHYGVSPTGTFGLGPHRHFEATTVPIIKL
jgi:hypothetical protein